MSTFSSVLRKPGQKITPRAAPRRNVQRQAQKATGAANLNALTPDTTTAGVDTQTTDTNEENTAITTPPDETSEERLPTPPATAAEQPSPPPKLTIAPVQIPSREHRQSVPPVVVQEPVIRAGAKRKAADSTSNAARSRPLEQLDATTEETAPASTLPKTKANKRRKLAPQGAPSYLLARSQDVPQPAPSTTPAQSTRSTSRSTSRQTQRAESEIQQLLQRSRSGLSVVSEISRSFDPDTPRQLRSRSRQLSITTPEAQDDDSEDEDFQPGNRIRALASSIIDAAARPRGRKRDRRGSTPNPDDYEIDPDKVQMGQLTRDSGLGKRSVIGRRLEDEWDEVKARWDENAAENKRKALENRKAKGYRPKKAKSVVAADGEIELREHAVQTEIVNGQIVLVSDAREVDFNADLNVVPEEEAKEDEAIYRYVNSNRIGTKAGRIGGPPRWDEEKTELFYKGLRMFGTDFEMIAVMLFPGKTRKEIKDKFVREERKDHERIIENTRTREGVENLEELMKENEMGELVDPGEVMRDLEREKEKLKDQHNERLLLEKGVEKAGDGGGEGEGADTVMPSIEVDGVDGEGDAELEDATLLEGEDEVAQVDGVDVAAPGSVRTVESAKLLKPRKTRQPRRTTRDTSKVKAGRKGKKPMEGVEERIGTIDDVER